HDRPACCRSVGPRRNCSLSTRSWRQQTLVDGNDRTPMDLIAAGADPGARGASVPPAATPNVNAAGARGSAAGAPSGGVGQRGVSAATAAEIRTLLQGAASR